MRRKKCPSPGELLSLQRSFVLDEERRRISRILVEKLGLTPRQVAEILDVDVSFVENALSHSLDAKSSEVEKKLSFSIETKKTEEEKLFDNINKNLSDFESRKE